MKISQTPDAPSSRIGWKRPSQLLKSPTTLTRWAFGAHTAKLAPGTPSIVRNCAPSFSKIFRSSPLPNRNKSDSPSVGRNEKASRVRRVRPALSVMTRS